MESPDFGKSGRWIITCIVAVIVGRFLLAFLVGRATGADPQVAIPANALPIRSCQMHDLDTLVKCDVLLPWDVALVNQSIRLHGVDACEVTRVRQAVDITDAELMKGREGLSKMAMLADGGRWYVVPTGESVYGRREGRLYLRTKGGAVIDLADWIRRSGYERPSTKAK